MLVIINHDKKSYTVVHTVSMFEDISRILTGLNQLGALGDAVEIYHAKYFDGIEQWRLFTRKGYKRDEAWAFRLTDFCPTASMWNDYDQHEVA